MLVYNSIRGVGSLSQGLQAKKVEFDRLVLSPPALPLYRGRDINILCFIFYIILYYIILYFYILYNFICYIILYVVVFVFFEKKEHMFYYIILNYNKLIYITIYYINYILLYYNIIL